MKLETIYLNMKTSQGVETVDEFTQETNQYWKDFRKYVHKMVNEYHISGMNVYISTRCTKEWKDK